ncbi:MAG TPA: CBS domain-containing protein [Actinomycetota bacterium]
MKVRDIMTTDVVTVGPEDSLKDAASILSGLGVSGLPVCDLDRSVLGVISEADILYKELDPKERTSGALAWLVDGSAGKTLRKARAKRVREAMSTPAITISPFRSVAEAARLMTTRGINRLPVVKGTTLVGIVTRADLVRAFLRNDEEIGREIREDVIVQALCLPAGELEVDVDGGNVRLVGAVQSRSDALLLERLAGRVPGVVSLESSVTWSVDDTRRPTTYAV